MAHFPHFWGKNFSPKNPTRSCTTPHGLLTLVSEKTNELILRKRTDRRTEGQTDPYSQDLSGNTKGSNKRKIMILNFRVNAKSHFVEKALSTNTLNLIFNKTIFLSKSLFQI